MCDIFDNFNWYGCINFTKYAMAGVLSLLAHMAVNSDFTDACFSYDAHRNLSTSCVYKSI